MITANDARTAIGLPRVCECGCGAAVTSRRRTARYARPACRTRAWKQRTGYGDHRGSHASRNAKTRRRRKPDLRISYRKAVDVVADELDRRGLTNPPGQGRLIAESWLQPLLTDRQRSGL